MPAKCSLKSFEASWGLQIVDYNGMLVSGGNGMHIQTGPDAASSTVHQSHRLLISALRFAVTFVTVVPSFWTRYLTWFPNLSECTALAKNWKTRETLSRRSWTGANTLPFNPSRPNLRLGEIRLVSKMIKRVGWASEDDNRLTFF